MIQLGRLEGFYRVALAQGYARAARTFPYPITQPGVHQQVRRLEVELGVRLFERVGKDRVVLTPEGRVLFEAVAPFLEGLPALEARVKGGAVAGVLRVHASGHALRQLLPGWLTRLHARAPGVEVALVESREPALAELRAGEADLVVDHLPELPADVGARVVARAHPFLVLPAAHPLAKRGRRPTPANLSGLAGEPLVAYGTDRHLRALQLQALARAGVTPRQVHAADSAETILALVAAGVGYSLIAWLKEGGPRQAGVVALPLGERTAPFPIHAAWRLSAAPHPLVQAALAVAPEA
jgi:DNA-binding transcriptional LysR family regulator